MPEPQADGLPAVPLPDFATSPLKLAPYESPLGVDGIQFRTETMPGRPVGRIMQLRNKRRRGEPLTDSERVELAAYYGRYTRRKKGVHLKGSREEEWMRLAERQGLSLSSWIQERVDEALRGPGEALYAGLFARQAQEFLSKSIRHDVYRFIAKSPGASAVQVGLEMPQARPRQIRAALEELVAFGFLKKQSPDGFLANRSGIFKHVGNLG